MKLLVIKVLKDIFVSFLCERIFANIAWKLLEGISKAFSKWAVSTSNHFDDDASQALSEAITHAKASYYGTKESIPTIPVQN